MWAPKSARAPVVPGIALKDKRIGLRAMRAGLKGKAGCHRRPQRRQLPLAVGQRNPNYQWTTTGSPITQMS